MRNHRLLPIATMILLIASLTIGTASETAKSAREADHNRKGLEYFNEAFYQQLPKGKQKEADKYFDLAAAEFKKALAVNPKSAEAYRGMARLHYVRKDFPQAIEDYRMVTFLEPRNIDAYLQLALSYTRINKPGEAIRVLETAKTKTGDPEVIGKLDGYIQKVRERK